MRLLDTEAAVTVILLSVSLIWVGVIPRCILLFQGPQEMRETKIDEGDVWVRFGAHLT